MILRDYQIKLIDDIRTSLKTNRRVLMQLPTGGGKTACSTYMIKSTHDKGLPTLFCVHRNELLQQASRTYSNFGIEHGSIISGVKSFESSLANIAMISTLTRRLDAIPIPKLVIVDEAHHATASSWSKVINHYYDNGSIIIGLSATPQRLDGSSLGSLFDEMVCGPSVSELISLGHLSQYRYYAPPAAADFSQLKKSYSDAELAVLMDKPVVFGDAIAHYKQLLGGKKAIAFNVNVQVSQNFAAQCVANGIKCVHVDGDTHASERAKHIYNFEYGDIDIISNVNLFGEGFDVKNCDGVILLRKTASTALFLQMVGRMMRPALGKSDGIILDHVNNVNVHGLPDEPRDWSLTQGLGRKKHQSDDEDKISIRQCTSCYYVYRPAKVCPKCGVEAQKTRREIEKVEAELEEIKERQKRTEVSKAKTLEDLRKIARERGYNQKWANIIYNSRRGRNG